jgi:uncharacterized damage-inducible protein DinB
MSVRELLLNEFDQEMSKTQAALERVPADKWDWKPHSKSGTFGWLAGHVATLPSFAVGIIGQRELEISGAKFPRVEKSSDLLEAFSKCKAEARKALAGVSDEQLRETWMLKWNGKVLFTLPRYEVLRLMCFNHLVHHRAQLGVYLRLNDIPVPATYGPSADEQVF